MASYRNTSEQARTWPNITVPATGRTLSLEPGETVDLDLPDNFDDPWLTPVAAAAAPAAASAPPAASSSPPATSAATPAPPAASSADPKPTAS